MVFQKRIDVAMIPKSLFIFLGLMVLLVAYAIYQGLTSQVDDKRFSKTIAGMQEMVTMTQAGDLEEGEKAFNEVHGFFHDLDPVLREKDPDLAKKLWDLVLQIETQYGVYRPDPDKLISYGTKTINLLEEAREKLN